MAGIRSGTIWNMPEEENHLDTLRTCGQKRAKHVKCPSGDHQHVSTFANVFDNIEKRGDMIKKYVQVLSSLKMISILNRASFSG